MRPHAQQRCSGRPRRGRTSSARRAWLNRIEAQFTALRYFALEGTDHAGHKEQGSMIRCYIIWRNKRAADTRLHEVIDRTNVARCGTGCTCRVAFRFIADDRFPYLLTEWGR